MCNFVGSFSFLLGELKPNNEETMFDLKYEHIHLVHTDPDTAVQFYKEALGADEVGRVERHGAPQVKLNCRGTLLIVRGIREGEVPMAAGTLPRMGVDHFGFWIGQGHRFWLPSF